MVAVDRIGKQFAEGFEFGGVGVGRSLGFFGSGRIDGCGLVGTRSFLHEPRIAGDLAKTQELGERGEANARLTGATGFEVEELAFEFFLGVAVKLRLRGCRFAPKDLLDFRGQLRSNGLFGSPQNVRRRLAAETFVDPSPIFTPQSRRHFVEVAGHEKFEKRTQIVERVFERCAR